MKFYSRLKIGTRLITVMVLAIIIVAVTAVGISISEISGYNNDENKAYVNKTTETLNNKVNDYKERAMQDSQLIAKNPDIVNAVESKDTAVILKALSTLTNKTNIDFVTVTDKNGKVLARSNDPKKFGDSVLHEMDVQMALKDTPFSAIEQGTVVPLSAKAGAPVKNQAGEIVGAISAGYKLDNYELLDNLKNLYGTDFTIFLNDVRLSTTIIKDGKRVIGTKLNPTIAEKVLSNGEVYIGNANILGTDYICSYMPFKDSNGKPLGVLFSGKSLSESKKIVVNIIISAFIITLILVLIIIAASYVYIRINVVKPLGMLTDSAGRLAIGDISAAESIKYNKKDEIGLLVDSFDNIVHNIKNQIRIVEKVAEGELNVKVEICSEKDVLSKSINTMVGTIKDLVSETELLMQAGIDGDLRKRGRTDRFMGSYREIIEGFNKMLDEMQIPMDYASQFIEKMADGSDLEVIDNIYKGYFGVLVGNLAKVRTSLYILVDESSKCAKAAVNGELTVRGDITNVKGGYLQILGGFNEALDAFLRPVNEAITVLAKLAVNDYSLEMKGNYYGMMSQFAEAINMVRKRLISVQDVIDRTSKGDLSRLEELSKVGKRSENDVIVPAVLRMMNTIQNLIDEVSLLTKAATAGNLEIRGQADKFEGGYRVIVEGINNTLDAMVNPLNEAISVIDMMSSNDYTSSMTGNYEGSFLVLSEAINRVEKTLNKVLGDINSAAEQVAFGSIQVSQGSQALSQGSTEQASSIEELTSTITQIAVQTKQNAMNASQANELALMVKSNAIQGNEQMKSMLKSMEEINESSGNISKIIKVIDEIAFQTNILALNAAVEAARAGQHGKGFAVVAEEVRNLAARSADAAKETTALIEGSIKKVEDGTKIANETAGALTKIVEGVTHASDLVADIAIASNEQATGITEINQGITQVSMVTQTNSATAEESAAASEELSGQAEMLKEMIGKFTLGKVSQSVTEYGNLNPDIIKMLEQLNQSKKLASTKEVKKGKQEVSKKPIITLSNSDFGKY